MLLSRRAHALVSRCAALPRGRSLLSCASSGRLYSVSGGLKPPQSRSAMGSAPDASVLSKVTILENLPLELKGDVVRGFGRGSKELGIPTANLPESEVDKLPANLPAGIYFGWATLHGKPPVYPMVMSIGWNPYYKNEKKTAEVHIIEQFAEDFYGDELRVVVSGFIRPEKDFPSLDALIEAIHEDISITKAALQLPPHKGYETSPFLTS